MRFDVTKGILTVLLGCHMYVIPMSVAAVENVCYKEHDEMFGSAAYGTAVVRQTVFNEPNINSVFVCGKLCQPHANCTGFFYTPTTKTCEGTSHVTNEWVTSTPTSTVYYGRKAVGFSDIGCFYDMASGSRVLAYDGLLNYSMTNELCFEYCKRFSAPYFGTQAHNFCFCGGDTYDQDGSASCSLYCGGNASQICGGFHKNSVYKMIYGC